MRQPGGQIQVSGKLQPFCNGTYTGNDDDFVPLNCLHSVQSVSGLCDEHSSVVGFVEVAAMASADISAINNGVCSVADREC